MSPDATSIDVPGGRIDVRIDRRSGSPSDSLLLAWVDKAGRAVAAYYRSFPVDRVSLTIHAGGPGKISGGRTMGEGGEAQIRYTEMRWCTRSAGLRGKAVTVRPMSGGARLTREQNR